MTKGLRIGLATGLFAIALNAQHAPDLKNQKDRLSYALGMDLGNQLRKQSVQIDPDLFRSGLKDALAGAKTRMTEAEVQASIAELQAELKGRQGQQNSRAESGKSTNTGQAPHKEKQK